MNFTTQEMASCLKVLQEVARDLGVIDGHDRLKSLITKIHRSGKKGKRQARRIKRHHADRAMASNTGVVRGQAGTAMLPQPADAACNYQRPRRCYICKQDFTRVHDFYHLLCPTCSDLNWRKRDQRTDLAGRVALVTGGRIKIGFEVSLKLLRDGARVHVTTRFPNNALARFNAQSDFGDWSERLSIQGLDLRDLPSVETFCADFLEHVDQLDIIIHNAAQTIKRPLAFYQHLLNTDADGPVNELVVRNSTIPVLLEARPGYRGHLPGCDQFFPAAQFDADGQQVDARPTNSWRQKLGEVDTIEMLEVMLVNTASPFIITSRLLPLMNSSPHARRFMIGVSAMEGQFNRSTKNAFHPHTNMAKAALNMLTRTSAGDLAKQGIYLNSVDTGWITDEKPLPQAQRVRENAGFFTPLDVIDGASRVYDPIARGLNEQDEPLHGHFLKDYAPYPW